MKQKAFLERLKTFVARVWVSTPYSRGYKVWIRLNEQLPSAVGAKVNDQPRIEKFSQLIKNLSFLDYYALKTWLNYKHKSLVQEWDNTEHFTGTVEQYYTKHIQICAEHLEAME